MDKLNQQVLEFIAKPKTCKQIADKFNVSTFDAKAIINELVAENKARSISNGGIATQYATKEYMHKKAKNNNANKSGYGKKSRKRYG